MLYSQRLNKIACIQIHQASFLCCTVCCRSLLMHYSPLPFTQNLELLDWRAVHAWVCPVYVCDVCACAHVCIVTIMSLLTTVFLW